MVKKFWEGRNRHKLFYLLLLIPAFAIVGTCILLPLVKSILMSFQEYRMVGPVETRGKWAGFANFFAAARGKELSNALYVTLNFVFFVVALEFFFALGTALSLNGGISGLKQGKKNVLQTLILLPWVTPTVIYALLWAWMFQPQYGVWNYVLLQLGLIQAPLAWLVDAALALPSVIVTALWRDLPFMFLMLFAGLQTIPKEPYEAALIDGAGTLRRFFSITLPFLRNVIRTTLLMAIITNFKQFPLFWTLTQGGPMDRTTNLSVLTYKKAFINLDFGQAAAVATVWVLGLVFFALVYTRVFRSGERE